MSSHQPRISRLDIRFLCIFVVIGLASFPPVAESWRNSPSLLGNCIWSFFGCIQRGGDESECNRDWIECKMIAMGMVTTPEITVDTTPDTATTAAITTTTTTMTTTPPYSCEKPPALITCIWEFNGCLKHNSNTALEEDCYKTYEQCKMMVMGMCDLPA